MYRTTSCSYTGQCPFTNTEQTINIEYFVIPVTQSLTPEYKKKGIHCSVPGDCPFRGKYISCPIYSNSPEKPIF